METSPLAVLPRTPSLRLDGKRAIVTGAGRGIGLACAAALAEAGAHVLAASRTHAEVEAVASAISGRGGSAEAVTLDVTDTSRMRAVVEASGPFDIFVNNAGGARHAPFLDVSEADFDHVVDLNVRAAFFAAQTVARAMVAAARGGSIINVSSQMGHVGGPGRSVYAATKHAVEGMTKAIAFDLGPHGVRVNTICPTFVETPMTQSGLADPEFRGWVLSKIKLGRLGRVEDLMGVVVFLASDASALMTGSAVMVDGGWTAG